MHNDTRFDRADDHHHSIRNDRLRARRLEARARAVALESLITLAERVDDDPAAARMAATAILRSLKPTARTTKNTPKPPLPPGGRGGSTVHTPTTTHQPPESPQAPITNGPPGASTVNHSPAEQPTQAHTGAAQPDRTPPLRNPRPYRASDLVALAGTTTSIHDIKPAASHFPRPPPATRPEQQ